MLKTLFKVFRAPKNEMKPDKIIVGLGNPGSKYRDTRHNIGYMVLAELASRWATGKPRNQFQGDALDARIGGKNVLLLCPTTYMNLSGSSIAAAVRYYKLDPKADLIVVCDDLDLPVAKIRVRSQGSAGGQKGLKDAIAKLGTQEFARLRVGIGRPATQEQVVNFVLMPFRKEERIEVDLALKTAADALERWVADGVEETMNLFNADAKKKKGSN